MELDAEVKRRNSLVSQGRCGIRFPTDSIAVQLEKSFQQLNQHNATMAAFPGE